MANVEMSLEAYEAIEQKITDLEKENENLKLSQKSVLVYNKNYKPKITPGRNILKLYNLFPPEKLNAYNYSENQDFVDYILKNDILKVNFEELNAETKEYRNLDSIIQEIRKEEENKLHQDIIENDKKAKEAILNFTTLKNQYDVDKADLTNYYTKIIDKLKNDNFNEIAVLKEKNTDEINKIKKNFEKRIEALELNNAETVKFYKKQLTDLELEFEDFKSNKKYNDSLEEALYNIDKLNKELEKQKNKSFWQRLFNI